MYSTSCPACNEDDCLYVVSGVFTTIGMRLCSDGFAFDEAQQVSTEEETVTCTMCGRQFSLADLHREEPPQKDSRLKLKGD